LITFTQVVEELRMFAKHPLFFLNWAIVAHKDMYYSRAANRYRMFSKYPMSWH